MAEGRILIADDDGCLRSLVVELLQRAGYATTEAASGEEALELARLERPLLLVLDVRLPGVSGYEVCRAVKTQFGQAVPVIFVSGERVDPLDRVAGLMLGADDYLVKPFAPDELLARVRLLVRRSGAVTLARAVQLTRRELEVLRLLANGLHPDEIARALVISTKTVGTHMEHIFRKLGVRSRAQAVAAAYRRELVGEPL